MPSFKIDRNLEKLETTYTFKFTVTDLDTVSAKLPTGSRKLLSSLESLDNTPSNYAKLLEILFWNFQEQGLIIR